MVVGYLFFFDEFFAAARWARFLKSELFPDLSALD